MACGGRTTTPSCSPRCGAGGTTGAAPSSRACPPLFFQHFGATSFVVHDGHALAAFLVGFLSPTHGDRAYVHFVGVDPARQGSGLGRALYGRFFDLARCDGRTITGVANTRSQAFHRRLGFSLSAPLRDYDGPGLDRVAMIARLDA